MLDCHRLSHLWCYRLLESSPWRRNVCPQMGWKRCYRRIPWIWSFILRSCPTFRSRLRNRIRCRRSSFWRSILSIYWNKKEASWCGRLSRNKFRWWINELLLMFLSIKIACLRYCRNLWEVTNCGGSIRSFSSFCKRSFDICFSRLRILDRFVVFLVSWGGFHDFD